MDSENAVKVLEMIAKVAKEERVEGFHYECLGYPTDIDPVNQLNDYVEYLKARVAIVADYKVEIAKDMIRTFTAIDGRSPIADDMFTYRHDDASGTLITGQYIGWPVSRELQDALYALEDELLDDDPDPEPTNNNSMMPR